jgi:hypothetical protein
MIPITTHNRPHPGGPRAARRARASDRGVGVTKAPSSKRLATMAARIRHTNLLRRAAELEPEREAA